MPWRVTEDAADCPSSKPFAVVLKDSGEVIPGGCHETKQDALDHLKALNANAHAATVEQFVQERKFPALARTSRAAAESALEAAFTEALTYVRNQVTATVRAQATTLVAAAVQMPPHVHMPSHIADLVPQMAPIIQKAPVIGQRAPFIPPIVIARPLIGLQDNFLPEVTVPDPSIPEVEPPSPPPPDPTPRPAAINPQTVFNPSWWEVAVKKTVTPTISDFYDQVLENISDELDVDIDQLREDVGEDDINLLEGLALLYGQGQEEWVLNRVSESLARGDDVNTLTETLSDEQGKLAGTSPGTFARNLVAQIWNVAVLTAAARAALHGAAPAEEGDDTEQPTATKSDLLLKRWISMRDNKVRDSHDEVDDDEPIPIDEDFDVNGHPAARPGDPRLPLEEVINCRCHLQISRLAGHGNEIILSLDEIDKVDIGDEVPDVGDQLGEGDFALAPSEQRLDRLLLVADPELRAEVERWNGMATQMHTHGRCRRCGGWLQGTKGCEKCGAGYHGAGAPDQPDRPTVKERSTPTGVVLPTTTQATMSGNLEDAGKVALGGVPEEAVMPTAAPQRAAATPSELVPWRGIIAVEGVPTGDGRLFSQGSLWWDERYVPFDLFVMTKDPEGGAGHDGSEIGGRVDKIWRQEADGRSEIWAEGVYDTSTPAGLRAAQLQSKNMLKGVSIDVDSVEHVEQQAASHIDIVGGGRMEAYSKGRIRRITVCSIPAFIEARISPIEADTEVIPGMTPVETRSKKVKAFAVKFNPGACKGKSGVWAVTDDAGKLVDCFKSKDEAVAAEKKAKAARARSQFQVDGLDAIDQPDDDILHIVVRDEGTCGAERPWAVVAPDGSTVACFEGRYDAFEAARDLDEDMYGDDDDDDDDEEDDDEGEEDEDGGVQVVIVSSGVRRRAHFVDKVRVWTPVREFGDSATQTLVASAPPSAVFSSVLIDVDPPAEVFRRREYNEFTPATIDAEGRISGHVTPHGECHIGFTNKCVLAPRSADGYRYARAGGHVLTAEGDMVPTARIFAQFTPGRRAHAPEDMGAVDAVKWYENQTNVVGDVAIFDDTFGIQVQGRVRPGVTRHQLVAFRGSDISPDWRTIRGKLECVGMACVNVSGFPSRYNRLPALVASGAEVGIDIDVPEEAEMVGSAWIAEGKVRTLVASPCHPDERSSNLVLMSAVERLACRVEELEQAELAREAETLLAGVKTEEEVQAELEALVASALSGIDGETEQLVVPDGDDEDLSDEEVDALHSLLVRLAKGQRPPRRCKDCGARMSYDQTTCPSCGKDYTNDDGTAPAQTAAGETETLEADPHVPAAAH